MNRILFMLALCMALCSCRSSQPPKIEICILDGFGGADCVEADGSKLVKLPSQMKNYWATSQSDMTNYSSWCYDASPSAVSAGMKSLELSAHDQ